MCPIYSFHLSNGRDCETHKCTLLASVSCRASSYIIVSVRVNVWHWDLIPLIAPLVHLHALLMEAEKLRGEMRFLPGNRMMCVSCSLERDVPLTPWQQSQGGFMKDKEITSINLSLLGTMNDWVDTLELLLAKKQNNNSYVPTAWRALGCVPSLSCHPEHTEPSADDRNLCPLQVSHRPNVRRVINRTFLISNMDIGRFQADIRSMQGVITHVICELRRSMCDHVKAATHVLN